MFVPRIKADSPETRDLTTSGVSAGDRMGCFLFRTSSAPTSFMGGCFVPYGNRWQPSRLTTLRDWPGFPRARALRDVAPLIHRRRSIHPAQRWGRGTTDGLSRRARWRSAMFTDGSQDSVGLPSVNTSVDVQPYSDLDRSTASLTPSSLYSFRSRSRSASKRSSGTVLSTSSQLTKTLRSTCAGGRTTTSTSSPTRWKRSRVTEPTHR